MAIRQTIIKRYESQQWVDNYPVTAWAYIENIPSTFPPSAHTHNYAGSSSAGGDANNAVKLNGQVASYYLNYNNFTNTPTIPTKTSQLTNDSGYLTSSTLTGDVVIDALGYTPGTSNFTGYTSSNKLSVSYISGLATVATSGSYNDLSNKPTIPTKASWNYDDRYVRYDTASQGLNATQKANARTNIGAGTSNFTGYTDSNRLGTGYIQGITEFDTLTEEISAMYSIMATKYVKPSGGIPASDLAQTYYLASNPNGYTSNIGTVTTVKLGSTSYSPTSGVISLPAYPTTLPASDVYSWAKAASKPSYTLDEVSDGSTRKLANYLPLSGGKLTGSLHINSTGGNWDEGIRIHPASNGWSGIVLCEASNTGDTGSSTKTWSIHNNEGTFGMYKNGSNIDSATVGITNVSGQWKIKSSGSVLINGQAVVLNNDSRLSDARNAADVYAWAKASTKPSYDASEITCDDFGDNLDGVLSAFSTAIDGKAASNHTHDTRYVRFDTASQGLNATQKSNARTNIGALSTSGGTISGGIEPSSDGAFDLGSYSKSFNTIYTYSLRTGDIFGISNIYNSDSNYIGIYAGPDTLGLTVRYDSGQGCGVDFNTWGGPMYARIGEEPNTSTGAEGMQGIHYMQIGSRNGEYDYIDSYPELRLACSIVAEPDAPIGYASIRPSAGSGNTVFLLPEGAGGAPATKTLATTDNIPQVLPAQYLTAPPSYNNTIGVKFVLLDSTQYPPANVTKYNGFIYMWY